MDTLSFKTAFTCKCHSNKDVLSSFKERSDTEKVIRHGMSPKEISDVVSDKIVAVIEKQFQETEKRFLEKEK